MNRALALNSAAHLLTDAICAAALFGPVAKSGNPALAVPLYNTLAFSTQCVVGLITDSLRGHQKMAASALALTALALLIPLPWLLRVVAVGLGNSIFHVAGGTVTLKNSENRAGPLGLFVAPGAIGLALGTAFPGWGAYFAIAALLLCVPMFLMRDASRPTGPSNRPLPWLAVAALLLAVAVRAIGGGAVAFPWRSTTALSLITVFCVFLGKTLGGFVCDRIGAKRTALLSIPLAAVLTAFCFQWALPSMAGQLLLNLTMPVTLWLLYRAMPDSPGLSFGLAASALWPGSILGGLISLTGPAASALTVLCFAFGLAAILYADKKIKEVHI